MREKLIKLIASGSIKCFEGECRNCEYDDSNPNCQNQLIADFLIKNGVVIPEEQSTKETVSKELYEQIKWERDTALNQLERVGLSLGEKTDDVVEVIRCGECASAEKMVEFEDLYACLQHEVFVSKNDFCSYGEPKEREKE